ncbi:MAG TPA: choice-of-anchor D domain-containing protein, partial [Candidatus Acidoferrales bacterium]|nr:choice-of-anchor D domain-containing protein [Candidatus Acidoferrales bacterium]
IPGGSGNAGDGGLAINAQLNNPDGVQVDPAGNIYIADSASHVIRKVNISDGMISTIAGTAAAGFSGDGGAANSAQLNVPTGILLDETGNLYIADSQNAVIRKVDVSDAPTLTFANTQVGAASVSQNVSLMNLGTAPLTIGGITAPANFSLAGSGTTCNLPSGESLSPATSCVLGIQFTPATAGSLTGSITVIDNANPTSAKIVLNGTAAALTETYTLAVMTPAITMHAGTNGTAMLTLNSNNYVGTISFATTVTSTDGTPANVTATATSVTLTAGGTGTSTVTVAANMSAKNHNPAVPWNGGTLLLCAALFGAPFTFSRKHLATVFPLVLVISLTGFLAACGAVGSSTSAQQTTTAARTYIVTVTPTGVVTPAGSVMVANPAPVIINVTIQ